MRFGSAGRGLFVLLAFAALTPGAEAQETASSPDDADRIAEALLAAPEGLAEGAAVLGFDESGDIVRLREGTNDLVCRGSDPAADRWEVVCYHASLEPWMARGRELRREGLTGRDVDRARWAEAEAGTLELPDPPVTLHVLTGDGYDRDEGAAVNPFLRWVLYVPYATPESTGLGTRPARGVPWLMDPGTPGAHIMITPEG